jgi:hypothetical protein
VENGKSRIEVEDEIETETEIQIMAAVEDTLVPAL